MDILKVTDEIPIAEQLKQKDSGGCDMYNACQINPKEQARRKDKTKRGEVDRCGPDKLERASSLGKNGRGQRTLVSFVYNRRSSSQLN